MTTETRRIYRSANGDEWYLARGTPSGRVFIRHKANEPSGGQVTEIEIGDFLTSGGHGPEHAELLQETAEADDGKDPAAKALGRKGGKARAEAMPPERRTEIARKAAATRWSKGR